MAVYHPNHSIYIFVSLFSQPTFDSKERDALLGKVSRLTSKVQSLEDRLSIMKSENSTLVSLTSLGV